VARVSADGRDGDANAEPDYVRRQGRSQTAERWDVGHRIRDVEVGPDGALWMLEDANPGALFRVTPKVATN
jgi:glucose/arabinose dehydrogenase